MADNSSLHRASRAKNDEFYTQLVDIEQELNHYKQHFKGKTVFCNCDDPFESNFFKYFAMNFNHLGLKKLICTCYRQSPVAWAQLSLFENEHVIVKTEGGKDPYKIEINEVADYNCDGAVDLADVKWLLQNDKNSLSILQGDGDFRSDECIELLKEADIVVTNPPFSLFREYVAQLMEYNKEFIIIGNKNSITYKEIFPLFSQDRIWLGYRNINADMWLVVPDDRDCEKIVDGKRLKHIMACWFTNLPTTKRSEFLPLYKRYNPDEYPKYDNYDAINVDKVSDIPYDYDGVMGVPITFLDKYNPDQFEIVAFRKGDDGKDLVYSLSNGGGGSSAILPHTCTTTLSDQLLTDEKYTVELQSERFSTAIPGMIKNAEGKIVDKITYARITIRKKQQCK